ncbi:MAG: Unknown protein [uncultured Sulfurovum sp.]|uniref:Uncharacterized protein n=1 Tax=uncultured Sulfurovum sp. TaxID=269237 RepID=A0A6S6SXX3_9BACT|nr:MAG: Unknown protein [uncultured Sulfurovum sp.]
MSAKLIGLDDVNIGDMVYDSSRRSFGKVVSIDCEDNSFPLKIKFKGFISLYRYTADGKAQRSKKSTLYDDIPAYIVEENEKEMRANEEKVSAFVHDLKEVLTKHKASISFSVDDCSDTHGISGEHFVVAFDNGKELSLTDYGWCISSSDIS